MVAIVTDHERNREEARTALSAKLGDAAIGAPLMVLYAFGIWGLLQVIRPEVARLAKAADVLTVLLVVQQLATIAFAALQSALFVLRRLPFRKAKGFTPRAVAILGSNFGVAIFLLPRVELGPAMLTVSTGVIAAGLIASIYCAACLGRSFSILPQARGFVSGGPYRIVRHPLYLSELIAFFGICFQLIQPWAFLVAGGSLVVQIARMHYEEQVLAETFPSYPAYMARTARLLPGLY